MTVLFHLYSSEGCHLCEQALALIANIIPEHQLRVVDIIDGDEGSENNLVKLYGVHIPVLERLSDNTTLFWPFEQSQVVELR
ncbi:MULTISPECIES: glutaredoxin family protein [unclassified Colwellia]|uniref:glutaredoxin family protein n=1 Tax=unclassified Colwellia TaxID=196834 RepID=UPI0015F6DC30|nr:MULTISPECIES: glutaredoxin family protein [unclassified Colwellia]MBA6233739.1 glutaredoxin family protein [Colwellia sp. MB02u-7]MBA6237880.1 glutaredoxin family protein [Colwellia sp. MB02u-11]MBA6257195.1 glutaredoxin family protein [Colwellia sp. MB3u-28]MBA6258780.1 glutaredoxin family protein [Colwellia sp. MB3u-41]MBA6300445.1 glutaredoxin family protein [Colwellia sp. MB3u-22]